MAAVLVVAVGPAATAGAQTLHYSWIPLTGDTTLLPGESVLLGLQAEFTDADGFATGFFNVRIDGFAHGQDSLWVADTRGVDNLTSDGDSVRERAGDGIGRIPRFRNSPPPPSLVYSLVGNLFVGDWSAPPAPGSIPVSQFGLPFAEPDRGNPITFFTIEFFAGETLGERVFETRAGIGVVFLRQGKVDIPTTLSPEMISADPITITVIPATPAHLALLLTGGLAAVRRVRPERRHP